MAQPWLTEVAAIEEEYHDSLRAIYRTAQERREAKADAAAADAAAEAEAADEVADTENAEPANAANQEPAANEEAGDNVAPEAAAGNENEPQEPLEGLPPSPEAETSTSPSSEGSADAASDAAAEEEPPPPGAGAGAAADAVEQSGAEADADSQEPADDVPAGEAPEEEPLTIQQVLTDSKQAELALVDKVVTWSHVIIGACLVVGLFTPIAALGGAVFLAMVISTQPPWVPGTQDTYYQFVEMFGLLVLAATCAGRWAGLDYFFACLFGKCRRS
jgi:uncharacterized membrane protein YphA (DoxX/SURF4 family)